MGADLNRLVVERMGSGQQFGGKLDAEVRVDGNGYKVESLVGDGSPSSLHWTLACPPRLLGPLTMTLPLRAASRLFRHMEEIVHQPL